MEGGQVCKEKLHLSITCMDRAGGGSGTSGVLSLLFFLSLFLSIKPIPELRVTFWQSKQSFLFTANRIEAVCVLKKRQSEMGGLACSH